jgi:hypothetical protein
MRDHIRRACGSARAGSALQPQHPNEAVGGDGDVGLKRAGRGRGDAQPPPGRAAITDAA